MGTRARSRNTPQMGYERHLAWAHPLNLFGDVAVPIPSLSLTTTASASALHITQGPLPPPFSRLDGARIMAVSSSSDVFILALGVVLAAVYLFRDQIFAASKPKPVTLPSKLAGSNSDDNPRDFIAKMKAGVSNFVLLRVTEVLIKTHFRKNGWSYSMVRKPVLQRNTPSVSLKKQSPSSVLLRWSVTLRNMTLRTWTKYRKIVLFSL